MGFFSWKTMDTDRSISNDHSIKKSFEVHLLDDKGNVYTERSYQGYGIFGGKDFYELLDEMNGGIGNRDNGLKLYYLPKKQKGKGTIRQYVNGKLIDFSHSEYNKMVDQWYKNLKLPIRYPVFVEDPKVKWQNKKPKECIFQGYFY